MVWFGLRSPLEDRIGVGVFPWCSRVLFLRSSMGSEAEKKAGIDEKVVAAAEREMRRPAPQTNPQPKKRRKGNEGSWDCIERRFPPAFGAHFSGEEVFQVISC